MTPAQLQYAEQRMQQKWYELVMAEQQGAAIPALERMYNAYVLAMEEYNRCSAVYQIECRAESDDPVLRKRVAKSKTSLHNAGQAKLAS
jgi:phage-related baseplate assembly protein